MPGRIFMMPNATRPGRIRPARTIAALALAATVLLVFCPPGPASAIRSHRHHATSFRTEDSLGSAWNHFLIGGPTLWASVRSPRFPSNVLLARRNGNLLETPFVDYLFWRRSLNPARFDLFHPALGPALGQLTPPSPAVVPTAIPGGSTQGGRPPTSTNPVPEVGVPEPTSLSTGLMMIAVAYGWRRRRSRKT